MSEPYDLERFVAAQAPVYATALAELRQGDKRSHWMWFVFPQLTGLGTSPMARRYAISSRDEALAYGAHALLGPRLRECTQAVLDVQGRSAEQILHHPDWLKFQSCMTLFEVALPDGSLFEQALSKYFGGVRDAATLTILNRPA